METVGDIGAGHTLGRYELLVPIATGGMASVWAARIRGTRGFQKVVAVKLMRTELIDDVSSEQMFLDEAALASRIKHANVVEIIDLGEQDGVLYQVMEWIDGEPLHHLIRLYHDRDGIPHHLAVRIGAQAASGLHAAHELRDDADQLVGLVHRDVSPQNLLIGYDGNVKILDFGVAKAASNSQLTVVGQVKGKTAYMAPEQARGERVDRRTDIFALGIVLYQLTTGKHPFRQDNDPATLRRIVDDTPAIPPSLVVPGYSSDLEAIVVKALDKDRNARFATMVDVMRALEALAPGGLRAGSEDVAAFVRAELGSRGERRRQAIRDALRVADEHHRNAEPGLSNVLAPPSNAVALPNASVDVPPATGVEQVRPTQTTADAAPGFVEKPTSPGHPAPPPPRQGSEFPLAGEAPTATVAQDPASAPSEPPTVILAAAPRAPSDSTGAAAPPASALPAVGGNTRLAAAAPSADRRPATRPVAVATPTPGPVAVAVAAQVRVPPPHTPLDEELERLARSGAPRADNRSVVGALVVACIIAVVAVAVYVAGSVDPPAPAPTPLGPPQPTAPTAGSKR